MVATPDLVAELRRRGVADVDDSTLARALYSSDASLYRVVPQVVARPRSTDEVIAVLDASLTLGVPVTMRGAGTSIAGNAVGPGIVVDTVKHLGNVLSVDPEIDPDVPAMIGASAALAISGVPFNGPIGAARVGYRDGQYLLNPTKTELASSQLNLVVAGTEAAVLMVESEANELSEEVMLGAVVFGHEQQRAIIEMIHSLVEEGGKPLWDWQPPANFEVQQAKLAQEYNVKSLTSCSTCHR